MLASTPPLRCRLLRNFGPPLWLHACGARRATLLAHRLRSLVFPDIARQGALVAGAVALALWLLPVAILVLALGPGNVFADIAVFFSKMAVVTFGGATIGAHAGREPMPFTDDAFCAVFGLEHGDLAAAASGPRRRSGRPRLPRAPVAGGPGNPRHPRRARLDRGGARRRGAGACRRRGRPEGAGGNGHRWPRQG